MFSLLSQILQLFLSCCVSRYHRELALITLILGFSSSMTHTAVEWAASGKSVLQIQRIRLTGFSRSGWRGENWSQWCGKHSSRHSETATSQLWPPRCNRNCSTFLSFLTHLFTETFLVSIPLIFWNAKFAQFRFQVFIKASPQGLTTAYVTKVHTLGELRMRSKVTRGHSAYAISCWQETCQNQSNSVRTYCLAFWLTLLWSDRPRKASSVRRRNRSKFAVFQLVQVTRNGAIPVAHLFSLFRYYQGLKSRHFGLCFMLSLFMC